MEREKILLVLDLDETLIFATKQPLLREADTTILDLYHVYKRPHLEVFLREMSQIFDLAIWSSASDDYVKAIVKAVIPADIPLQFVWGRSRCSQKSTLVADDWVYYYTNSHATYYHTKPLKKLKKKGYSLEKILILDDSPEKVRENYGNAIYPQAYLGSVEDNELKLLVRYLPTLKAVASVLNIEKRGWRSEVLKDDEGVSFEP